MSQKKEAYKTIFQVGPLILFKFSFFITVNYLFFQVLTKRLFKGRKVSLKDFFWYEKDFSDRLLVLDRI